MRTIVNLFAALFWLAAAGLLLYAFIFPAGYNLATASAPQVTQVYSQATYYGVLAIAAGIVGLFLVMTSGRDG